MSTEGKKITITELQTFIEAVEFATDADNWVPSERQWQRIRTMIDNLVESTPVKTAAVPTPAQTHEVPRTPDRPVTLAPGSMPPPRMMTPNAPPILAGSSPGIPVRTPDIDTSSGSYQSSFGV